MNDYIRELVQKWLEDNGRISDLATEIYDHAFEEGRRSKTWLEPVTSAQVLSTLNRLEPEVHKDEFALADWFNDPNRDAPAKATMHPDLEWLASRPVTDFRLNCDRSKVLGFYRKGADVAAALRPEDGRLWASNNPPVFSLEAIHQARKHLVEHATLDDAMIEERTAVLMELNNLPDYETWFENHGADITRPFRPGDRPATVHELYTHFRARLLDELRQAGVIGDDHD